MSNSTIDTFANSRKIRNISERLDDLEKATTMLMSLVDRELGSAITQVNALSDVINAITDVVGLDRVQAALTEKAVQRLNLEQQQMDDAAAAGRVVKAEKITPSSIIGYEEKDANGQIRPPGKFFKNLSVLAPQAKQLLDGQAVGFEAGIGNGATMKVLEIWEMVAAPEATEEAPATAPETTTPAAE
jgi:hypothetical protein